MSVLYDGVFKCRGCRIHPLPQISIVPVNSSVVLRCYQGSEVCGCIACQALLCHDYAANSSYCIKTNHSSIKPDLRRIRARYSPALPKSALFSFNKDALYVKYKQRLSYVELLIQKNTDSQGYVTLDDSLISNLIEVIEEYFTRTI